MKNKLFYILQIVISCFIWGGCDIAYKYDIESGTDDYTADEPNVSVKTESGIDVSMYEQARIFPGLVDTVKEERIDATVVLDLTKRYVDAYTLGMQQVPKSIYSTGLYAGAGELITIEVPDNVMGLTVQVGSHTDDLTSVSSFLREPVVYTSKALFPGDNTVRNPLGGNIWILKNGNLAGSAQCELKISGAYRSCDYILGETDVARWVEDVKKTTVPWLEIRGKRVVFTVPRSRIEEEISTNGQFASNLEGVLKLWDEAMVEYFYKYNGLEIGSEEQIYRAPDYPERVIIDVQLEDNYFMRIGKQGIMAVNSNHIIKELTNVEVFKTGGSSSIFKMLTENYSTYSFRKPWWGNLSTAANYLPLYRVGEKTMLEEGLEISDIFPDEDVKEGFPLALSYAKADSTKWVNSDINRDNVYSFALLPIVQLGYYGTTPWESLENLNVYFRTNFINDNDNGEKVFQFLCDYYKKDFTPFFEHWGFTLKDAERVYASRYPMLDKKIWEYDPFNPEKEIGEYDYSHYQWRTDRTNWTIIALDKDYNTNYQPKDSWSSDDEQYGALKIIDGDKSTAWRSDYSNSKKIPEQPYYIVIDMQKPTQINGFYLANGTMGDKIQHLIVQTTDATDINLNDSEVEWKDLSDLQGTDFKAAWRNERFFEFDSSKTLRYLRLVIPDVSHVEKKEENKDFERKHTLAEFGTFYYK